MRPLTTNNKQTNKQQKQNNNNQGHPPKNKIKIKENYLLPASPQITSSQL